MFVSFLVVDDVVVVVVVVVDDDDDVVDDVVDDVAVVAVESILNLFLCVRLSVSWTTPRKHFTESVNSIDYIFVSAVLMMSVRHKRKNKGIKKESSSFTNGFRS